MHTATRRRTTGAIAASVIAHLLVGIVLLLQKTTLVIPAGERGPPEAIIPVLIMPRTPLTAGGKQTPQPIRLHRRPQPFLPPDIPAAPIAPPAAPAPTGPPAPTRAPVVVHPAPLPEGPKGDVRTALRQSFVGCANQQAVGLNHAEVDLCNERFGKGAKDAAYANLGLAGDKQRLLDAAGARKDADYRYKYGPALPNGLNIGAPGDGVAGSGSRGIDNIGSTAHGLANQLGNDRPDAKSTPN
jgi:hypothetical protein